MNKKTIDKAIAKFLLLLEADLKGQGASIAAMMALKEKSLVTGTTEYKFDVSCTMQLDVETAVKNEVTVRAKHKYGASHNSVTLSATVSDQDDIPGLGADD